MHGLEGVWISVDPIRALDPTDEIAVRKVEMKIGMMVPLKDIRDLPN
jgi:hypothetical protein